MTDIESIIEELRHRLYYSDPGPEREAIRCQLEFWLHYRPENATEKTPLGRD